MKAMILAAGRGERMRPLTDHTPKPLLEAGGKPLIVWHIERLVAAGMRDIVINCAWLGARLQTALGDGRRFNARLRWSVEEPALETAGGIAHALPSLGPEAFVVINGDVWSDWDPSEAPACAERMKRAGAQAWLLLADNPAHHSRGDFQLDASGLVLRRSLHHQTLTFTGIGIYDPQLFEQVNAAQAAPLAPLLHDAIDRRRVIGARHDSAWMDIGTPERLKELNEWLAQTSSARTEVPSGIGPC